MTSYVVNDSKAFGAHAWVSKNYLVNDSKAFGAHAWVSKKLCVTA